MGRGPRRKAGLLDALDPGTEGVEATPAELLLDPKALDEDGPGPGLDGAIDLVRHLAGLPVALRDPCLQMASLSFIARPELGPALVRRTGHGGQPAIGRFVEDPDDALVRVVAAHLFVELGRFMGVSPERVRAENEPRDLKGPEADRGKGGGRRRSGARRSARALERLPKAGGGERRSRHQEIAPLH